MRGCVRECVLACGRACVRACVRACASMYRIIQDMFFVCRNNVKHTPSIGLQLTTNMSCCRHSALLRPCQTAYVSLPAAKYRRESRRKTSSHAARTCVAGNVPTCPENIRPSVVDSSDISAHTVIYALTHTQSSSCQMAHKASTRELHCCRSAVRLVMVSHARPNSFISFLLFISMFLCFLLPLAASVRLSWAVRQVTFDTRVQAISIFAS